MFTIEQSPFLHALGYSIGHSLWQMSLLWLVYTAVVHLHQWTSSQRYNFAVGAATAGFVWFIITLFYYASHVNLQQENQAFSGVFISETSFPPTGKFIFIYHSLMATLRSLAPYFSCAYLFVMLVLSIRLANGFNQVKQLRTDGLSKASVDWRLFVKKHAELLGIKKPVLFFISNIATSPLTIGFWKPFILIPIASINQLTPQQLEAVLLHELAHIRRNDYLFNIILQLAEITLFFNPFMRLLLKHARLERENSCDDYVLQFQYNAAEYAKALLTIEQHSVESLLALGTNNQNEFQLLTRIKRMVAPERRAFNYRQQLGLLFLVTLLGLGFTVISPRPQTETATVETNNKTVQPLVKEEAIITATEFVPQAIDLVKNLENFKGVENPANSKEFKERVKKLEADARKASDKLNLQMQPHLKQIEKTALQVADLSKQHFNLQQAMDMNIFQVNGAQWNEAMGKADWTKVVAPLLEQNKAALALIPGVSYDEKWPVMITTPPPAAVVKGRRVIGIGTTRDQLVKMERLHRQLNLEQKQLMRMAEVGQIMADSLNIVFTQLDDNNTPAALAEVAVARAKKEAAIAPYRQVENNRPVTPPVAYYRFDYSNDSPAKNDDKDEDQIGVQSYTNVYTLIDKTTKNKRDCDRPQSQPNKTKTIALFNGKAFSEKVKQVWAEAQQQADENDGWTNDMKKQVVHEIEKELRELEHVEVRTRISSKPDSKTIVIEVETTNN
jgi:beta-lactamase regulating signal transducer with metallopeptidase domain